MNCTKCGHIIVKAAKFCHECGTPLVESDNNLRGHCIVSGRPVRKGDAYFRCAQCNRLCLRSHGFENSPLCSLCADETGLAREREALRAAEEERLRLEAEAKAEAEEAARKEVEEEAARKEEGSEERRWDKLFEWARDETGYMKRTSREKSWRLSLLAYLEVFTGRKGCKEAFASQYAAVDGIKDLSQRALSLGRCVKARWKACPDLVDGREIHALFERLFVGADEDCCSYVAGKAVEAFCRCRHFDLAKRWALKTGTIFDIYQYNEQLVRMGHLDKAMDVVNSLSWDDEDIQRCWSSLAKACADNGLYDEALEIREHLVSGYLKKKILNKIAWHQAKNNHLNDAEKTLRKYHSSSSDDPFKTNAAGAIAKTHARNGNAGKALSYIGKVDSFHNVWIYIEVVRGLIKKGQSANALDLLGRKLALRDDRKKDMVREACATALVEHDEVDKALVIHDPDSDTIYDGPYETAWIAHHIRNGRIDKAEDLTIEYNYGGLFCNSNFVGTYKVLAKHHVNCRDRILPFIERLEARRNSWCVSAYTLTILCELHGIPDDFYMDFID